MKQRKRDAVLELFQASHGAQDIIKLLHYPKSRNTIASCIPCPSLPSMTS
ncbi:Hypothetical protein FKW44_014876 [Caligus rogercresseyi]|uniref:Uncharacterized protein n=1 Tax=Caligus rogercresseyi TaxID=217165 RepID=A0A7T8GZL5_CALRO|nr:Hypothetical protein FKW44_014876 [Caligus rogercresseyi]